MQKFGHKGGGCMAGVQVGALHLLLKMFPLRRGNLKGAAVLVLLLEPFGDAVVSISLQACGS